MCVSRRGLWILLVGLAALGGPLGAMTAVAAPPTPEQRTQLRTAEAAVKKVGNLYRSQKFAEAGVAFKEAQESVAALAGDDSREVTALTAPLARQLAKLREQLAARGVELPPVKADKPAAGEKPKPPAVSFTKQVAPILVAHCAGCHIQRARGEFSMGSYVALAKGSKSGTVIMAGDAAGSRIVELIESGDMPRGGGKVSAEELATISAWINAGARFDGPDSAAPLTSFAPPKKDAEDAKLKVVAANGREAVLFARDVGPILVAQCLDCHGQQNPRNNFSVQSFDALLRGGDSGVVLVPGKPEESLLVKKLRGAAGERMPLNKPALNEESIGKFENWIRLGAKFDGSDSAQPLEETVERSIAERATHEELSKQREELAARHWRLVQPDAKANHEETTNLLVYGSAGRAILADVARSGEEQIAKLRKLLKLPAEGPLIKGRLTIFVFEKRYEYTEVGTMLEHREIPAAWRGHWQFNPLDAYGCVLLSSSGDASPGLLAQQITGAYVASLGKIPRWFAEGMARYVAARAEPKDPRVKAWDEQAARILVKTDKPAGFLTGATQPEDDDVLSYSFVKFLIAQPSRHAALMTALEEGTSFDSAFAKAYGGNPTQVAGSWLARAGKRGR